MIEQDKKSLLNTQIRLIALEQEVEALKEKIAEIANIVMESFKN